MSEIKSQDTVRIAQWGGRHIVYLPFYIALQCGCFEEEGITAEVYRAGNDDEIFAEVAQCRADFAIGDPAFVAIGDGIKSGVKVIAPLVHNVCMWAFTPHPEIREIKTPADLVTLRFGCYPRPSTSFTLLAALKARYPRILKSMEIVEAPIGAQAALLASGRADLVLEIEPMVSLAEEQGYRVVLSMNRFYREQLFTGIMASRRILAERRDLALRMVTALQKAFIICHSRPETALEVARTSFPALPEKVMRTALARLMGVGTWPTHTLISTSAWKTALDLRYEVGEVKAIPAPESFLDLSFAQRVLG